MKLKILLAIGIVLIFAGLPWVAVIILLVIIGAFTGFFWDIMFGGSS